MRCVVLRRQYAAAMPFESIDTNASLEEAQAWQRRMEALGYRDVHHVELSMRLLRDCRTIKDPLKIAVRFLNAYDHLSLAARKSKRHPDARYHEALASAQAQLKPQVIEQVALCLKAFSDARKAMLAGTSSGKRQLAITRKTIELLGQSGVHEATLALNEECGPIYNNALTHWYDQEIALNRFW